MTALKPGSTIGIVGGGQLGRMTALAAARLGYRCHIFSPEADGPGAQVAAAATVADYDDLDALRGFARAVDVVTYEFENIPLETIRELAEIVPTRPGPRALEISQHRLIEKNFARAQGIATAEFAAVHSAQDLQSALDNIGYPAILKTCRFGYDGKGQVRINSPEEVTQAWADLATDDAILEVVVGFEREVSVIVARGLDQATAVYPPVENCHVNHILDTTIAPAAVPVETAAAAIDAALKMATAIGIEGLLAVEFFVTPDGQVLLNEIAPRPHNSGHWTQDGAVTDQFEQLVRAICGLPLGDAAVAAPTVMQNLIGNDVAEWPRLLAAPRARLHLYGKAESRPGRKMGHVNWLGGPPPKAANI